MNCMLLFQSFRSKGVHSGLPLFVNRMANMVTSSASVYSNKLQGKNAIVTASTDGIGFAVAKKLALDGANVMISSRQQKNVDRAVAEINGICKKYGLTNNICGTVAHVAKSDDRTSLLDEAVKKFGGLDILVSNAAVSPSFGPLIETTEVAWDKVFEINVKVAFLLVQQAVPVFKKSGGGSVVFISSIAGYQPMPFIGAYSISKTALLGLTNALAGELAVDNIRINCVCPGVVKTKFSRALVENETIRDMMLQQIPMRRFAEPDEMSGIVSFLCSDDASYVTGENIVVAGGMQSHL